MRLNKRDRQKVLDKLFYKLSQGESDENIAQQLGLETKDIQILKLELFDLQIQKMRSKSAEENFVDWMIQQKGNIQELTTIIEDSRGDTDSRGFGARVSAIKARSDMYNKILDEGRACGVLKKDINKEDDLDGENISDLTDNQIRQKLTEEIENINNIMTEEDENISEIVQFDDIYQGEEIDLNFDDSEK